MKINERNVYQQYIDQFLSSGFIPRIPLPTRLSRRSGSLIDQIFHRNIGTERKYASGIVVSKISDHFPYFICLDINQERNLPPKKVIISTYNEAAVSNFSNEVDDTDILSKLDPDLCTVPDQNCRIILDDLGTAYKKKFPVKTVKFSKYKHKNSKWITSGIIRSIYNRDRLYRKLKSKPVNSEAYNTLETNLSTIDKILKVSKRLAKKNIMRSNLKTLNMI